MDFKDNVKSSKLKKKQHSMSISHSTFKNDSLPANPINTSCSTSLNYSVVPNMQINHNPIINRNSSTYGNYLATSKEEKKRFKMPEITRGIALALFFFIFMCLIIIWFFFSADLADEDFAHYGYNSTNGTYNHIYNRGMQTLNASKGFVILSTVIIVIIIILLVFLSSLIQYLRNPSLYTDEADSKLTPRLALTSIFATPQRNLRNDFYYLDLNMKNCLLKKEAEDRQNMSHESAAAVSVTTPIITVENTPI